MQAMSASHRRAAELGERIEHDPQIERGMTDSLEHIGGSGLLLQQLAQFMEQARVFDGDYALSGETLQQFNLPVGERMNLLAVQRNRANQLAFSQHRHAQDRPHAAAFDSHDRERIAVEMACDLA